ncbi:MAG: DNA-processing protein DprA [Pseudomonadota bacterium]
MTAAGRTLTTEEKIDWLQLISTDTIGPVTFFKLLSRFGSAREALFALRDISKKTTRGRPLRPGDRIKAEDELKRAEAGGIRIIALPEPDYPKPLRVITDPPPVIWVKGHPSLFSRDGVAIIGARNASAVGRKMARDLAEGLCEAGLVIVSGLARGIDGIAHEAGLNDGTIAVVAGGVDVIYPPEHDELTAAIGNQGAIMSERPLGTQPTARDFPRRNRLISGLSFGVVVVEAAARSGTLITARFALDQGREVFAVPGSPLDPRCQGANSLIRDGATLVQDPDDILDVFRSQRRSIWEQGDLFDPKPMDDTPVSEEARQEIMGKVKGLLGFTPIHRDDLVREIDGPVGLIMDALIDLVISGEVEEQAGGTFALTVSDT